ncbi:hypothetical protein [Algoriphagus boritolerans]|uniref:hypothetical protein n=1 Tax=Algoriphagus boritolerans TaxID=308111 RepID=UPI000A913B30
MKEIGNWEIKSGDNLIVNTPLPDFFIQEWKAWYDRALAGEAFSVVRKVSLIQKGGYMEVYFKPIFEENKVAAVGCYSLDVTKLILEEQKQNELLERLNLAQKIGKLGYWEFDVQTEEIYWSDEIFVIWGINKSRFNPNFELFFLIRFIRRTRPVFLNTTIGRCPEVNLWMPYTESYFPPEKSNTFTKRGNRI